MKKIFYQIYSACIISKEKKKSFRQKYIAPLKLKKNRNNIECSYREDHTLIVNNDLQNKNQFYRFNNNVCFCGNNFVAKGTKIGLYSYIGEYTKVDPLVTIGRYSSIADNVLIGATKHPKNWLSTSPFQYDTWLDKEAPKYQFEISKETVIGNDVWIGSRVIVQSGVTIGDGAIIGSGAVVTHNIPPYAIAVGIPAKIIKYRFNEDTINKLLTFKWWNMPHDFIKKLPFNDIEKCIEILS